MRRVFALLMLSGSLSPYFCFASVDGVDVYRFEPTRLDVPASLPLGTVLAVASVPCGTVNELRGQVRRELRLKGGPPRVVPMVATNVRGVGIRIVLDSRPLGGGDLGAQFPWSLGAGTVALVRDDIRIELVKTGPMFSGILKQVAHDIQFRRTAVVGGKVRIISVKTLHYSGGLHLNVTKAVKVYV